MFKIKYLQFLAILLPGIASGNAVVALTAIEQAEMVAAHNRWRHEVGVPAVRWSQGVAEHAQRWAHQLQQSRGCKLQHSGTRGIGENLYWASALHHSDGRRALQAITPAHVTNAWGGEQQHYDHAANSCTPGRVCGHYTQMVWRATTEIGCARAVCGDQSQVWVCNYSPPGNWRGQQPY